MFTGENWRLWRLKRGPANPSLQIAIISNFNPIRISGDGEVIVLKLNRDHGLVQPTKPRDFLLKFCFVRSETKIATTAFFSSPLFFSTDVNTFWRVPNSASFLKAHVHPRCIARPVLKKKKHFT